MQWGIVIVVPCIRICAQLEKEYNNLQRVYRDKWKAVRPFPVFSNYVYIECILRNLLYILQRPKQWSLVVLVTGIYICAAIEKYPNNF